MSFKICKPVLRVLCDKRYNGARRCVQEKHLVTFRDAVKVSEKIILKRRPKVDKMRMGSR